MSDIVNKEMENIYLLAKQDAETIENWYLIRKQQALLELERLETVYNERMEDHYSEWSQKIHDLCCAHKKTGGCLDKNSLCCGGGDCEKKVLPIPKLTRKTNMRYLNEYSPLWSLCKNNGCDDNTNGYGGSVNDAIRVVDKCYTKNVCIGTDDDDF